MKFDVVIKKLSAFLAAFVVYVFAASTYLMIKGFVIAPDGQIVLVKQAMAQEPEQVERDFETMRFPNNYVWGNENAPITLYEYSSLGCPHCADFHLKILPQIEKEYIKTGKLNVIYADYPLDKKSMRAALLAHCMAPEKYYDFVKMLYSKQLEWGLTPDHRVEKLFIKYAGLNGVDEEKAKACLKNEAELDEIADIRKQAFDKLKIASTPTIVLVAGDQHQVFVGAPSYRELKQAIDSLVVAPK